LKKQKIEKLDIYLGSIYVSS